MRRLFLAALTLVASASFADTKMNNVLVDAGFASGGFAIGGAYEYLYNGSQGIGAQLQMFQKDNKHSRNGVLVIGGFTGYHFYKGTWDFSVAPGLNIINISAANNGKDVTSLGPGLQISLTQALNDKVAIGFDYQNYYIWFDDDYRGKTIDNLAFKLKVSF